ncbi:MAG: hypothetical protein KA204_03000 [Chromatiaceae bacterium]|nr:hypothetical protein [Chromatiaceae bacterium]MBP6806866.1 hypothetical protein [Chromatiaceae bacterium]
MNEKIIARLIKDLIASNELPVHRDSQASNNIRVPGYSGLFTVTVEYKNIETIRKSIVFSESLNRAQTISALPSGAPCGCCGGSGRER